MNHLHPDSPGPLSVVAVWLGLLLFGLAFWALVIWALIRMVAALGW